MGDMADWAFDQILDEEYEEYRELTYYRNLSQEDLMEVFESIVNDTNYEQNTYTDMALDIYMKAQCGHVLTHKQILAIARHLVNQEANNWY